MTAPTTEQGWQPIETAPRDGTVFLAGRFGGDIGSITVARQKRGWSGWQTVPGDWPFVATHWQPLPEPPTIPPASPLPAPVPVEGAARLHGCAAPREDGA